MLFLVWQEKFMELYLQQLDDFLFGRFLTQGLEEGSKLLYVDDTVTVHVK